MKLLEKFKNSVYRKQRLLTGIAVFSIFMAISFRIDSEGYRWLWSSYPFMALLLVLFSITITVIWIKIEQSKIQSSIDQVKEVAPDKEKIEQLSNRQLEVFGLIAKGKSNKEITHELHIELSTSKTHINNIYRLLEIKNRKELRNLAKRTSTDEES